MTVFSQRNIFIGILASFTMDVLSAVSFKLRLIAPLSPRLIGRWFASMVRGQLLHSDIGQVAPIKGEMTIAVHCFYGLGLWLSASILS